MSKICLLTDQHICTNPRLWKEAISFSKAGYEVVILTVFTTEAELDRDWMLLGKDNSIRYKAVLNLIPGKIGKGKRFFYRARRKLAVLIKLYFGIESPYLLGYAPDLLLAAARNEKADLYVAHMECSQYVGKQLSEQGHKVAFDIEDWYSRDYLVPERPVKLLESLERYALVNGEYVTCPSDSMAKALQDYYKSEKTPLAVYNSFSKLETPLLNLKQSENTKFSILWYSQTIGPGRGLEAIIKAINLIKIPIVLKLIGDISVEYQTEIEIQFSRSNGHQLIVSKQIPHHELTDEIAKHDLGLALENDFPESKNLTVSNKILQYTQSGIRVLATNTKGQQEIAALFPESIHLLTDRNAVTWAEEIEKIAQQKFEQADIIKSKFNEMLSWESQEQKMLTRIAQIFTC